MKLSDVNFSMKGVAGKVNNVNVVIFARGFEKLFFCYEWITRCTFYEQKFFIVPLIDNSLDYQECFSNISNFPLEMLSHFFDKNSSINHSFSNDEIKFLSTRLEN